VINFAFEELLRSLRRVNFLPLIKQAAAGGQILR
jgi:hypothetical protein